MNASWTRIIILAAAVVNAVLNMLGYQTIPDETVNDLVALVSGGYFLFMAWKNNYLSKKGKAQKAVLDRNDLS